MKPSFSPEQETEIVASYESGEPLRRLSTRMKTSDRRIKDVLASHDVTFRKNGRPERPLSEDQKVIVRELRNGGDGYASIARSIGVETYRVKRFLVEEGYRIKAPGEKMFDAVTEQLITQRYIEGVATSVLTKEFGCGAWTIRDIVRRQGGEVSPRGNRYRQFGDAEMQKIFQRWESGESQTSIAESLRMGQTTLSKLLARNGYAKEIRRPRGKDSPLYRGGRYVNQFGYVAVSVPPDHQFAVMRNGAGMILEHRLVMAEQIGRPLTRTEQVHHIDGNRGNNNPENLELRQSPHGKGVKYMCAECGSHHVIPVPLDGGES